MTDAQLGDLQIFYIPQIPMPAFTYPVPDRATGELLLDAIYELALFEFEHKVKPDYANVGGVQVFEDNDNPGDPSWYDADEE
jgi:hypothetical protein